MRRAVRVMTVIYVVPLSHGLALRGVFIPHLPPCRLVIEARHQLAWRTLRMRVGVVGHRPALLDWDATEVPVGQVNGYRCMSNPSS